MVGDERATVGDERATVGGERAMITRQVFLA